MWGISAVAAAPSSQVWFLCAQEMAPAVITVFCAKIQHEILLWGTHLMVYDGYVQAGIR